ncbi:MAG: ribokinase [Clostridia bacterium]|nr:ribokinase [Clostridia bacterium]
MNFVVIGSINTYLVIHTDRLPKAGETLSGSGFFVNCGGKGANQAVALAKLGGTVIFIGAVGNDTYGDAAIENLKKHHINTDYIIRTKKNTGVAVITVYDGENSIILDRGANALVTPEVIYQNKEIIQKADALLLQLEIPIETVVCAARMAHQAGVKVILNPAPITDLPEELIQNTDILILNETEAEFLTGITPDSKEVYQKCIAHLQKLGCKNIILTLGKEGSLACINDRIIYQSAYLVEAVDTTAAGDTFIGAFCTKMGLDVNYAMQYATGAAAIAVSRNGASDSVPIADEVDQFIKKYEESL